MTAAAVGTDGVSGGSGSGGGHGSGRPQRTDDGRRRSLGASAASPAVLATVLNRARSPSPTWTDDSAASAVSDGRGFDSSEVEDNRQWATHKQLQPKETAAQLIHNALHDVAGFIDLTVQIAASPNSAAFAQSQALLNHPPQCQGEINYAVTVYNAVKRLSSASRGGQEMLLGAQLMSSVHRMVTAHGSAAAIAETTRLKEAVKFLLVLSEVRSHVLQKSHRRFQDVQPGISHARSEAKSPQERFFRALSGTGNNSNKHAKSDDGHRKRATQQQDAQPDSFAFAPPDQKSKNGAPSETLLSDAQRTIHVLRDERRALQEEIEQLSRAQEQSMRLEREKVKQLEVKLKDWQTAIDKLGIQERPEESSVALHSQDDSIAMMPADSGQDPSNGSRQESLHRSLQDRPDALIPHAPMYRPSFESWTSRQGPASGSVSPAAASSGNNTPSKIVIGLPDDFVHRQDGDHAEEKTPRADASSGLLESAASAAPCLVPVGSLSFPREDSPASPSDGGESDEFFADTIEHFDGQQVPRDDEASTVRTATQSSPDPASLPSAHELPQGDRRASDGSFSAMTHPTSSDTSQADWRASRTSTNCTSPPCSVNGASSGTKQIQSPLGRSRDRFSLPPQAPQPTSPLPDVPSGVTASGNCSPAATHKRLAMQRSSSDRGVNAADRGYEKPDDGEAAAVAGSSADGAYSGMIPVGLGFAHFMDNKEKSDDHEERFDTAPSTLSRSSSLGNKLQRPQSSSARDAPPAAQSLVPFAIAEEGSRDEQDGHAQWSNRFDADIILPPQPDGPVGATFRGFRSLFKREREKDGPSGEDSAHTLTRQTTPGSSNGGFSSSPQRARAMTNSSILSTSQSADTHFTHTTKAGCSMNTTTSYGTDGIVSAATSVSDKSSNSSASCASHQKQHVQSRPPSHRGSITGSIPEAGSVGMVPSTSSSSMNSERRRHGRELELTQRRDLDLAALGITSPPIADRSKYNRGSRSKILGHTSSMTNLNASKDGNSNTPRRRPARPAPQRQHPTSLLVSKAFSNVDLDTGRRRRTLSSLSHDACSAKSNGGYGYVNGKGRAPKRQDDFAEEQSESEDASESEHGGAAHAANAPAWRHEPEAPRASASRPASLVSNSSYGSARGLSGHPVAQEQAHIQASRRLKFSRR